MKNSQWTVIVVGAFIVGVLFGYAIWGSRAGRLAGMEKELSAAQAQADDAKKKMAETEANLGKVANEKLTLEKQVADMKEAAEKGKRKAR